MGIRVRGRKQKLKGGGAIRSERKETFTVKNVAEDIFFFKKFYHMKIIMTTTLDGIQVSRKILPPLFFSSVLKV